MRQQDAWRVISFTGWFLTFLGVSFLLLFMVSFVQEEILSSMLLTSAGLIMAIVGEYMRSTHKNKVHRYVWEALSLSGIFCLSAGILWLIMRSAIMRSYLGIGFVLLAGVLLIILGETRIRSEKQTKIETRGLKGRKKK